MSMVLRALARTLTVTVPSWLRCAVGSRLGRLLRWFYSAVGVVRAPSTTTADKENLHVAALFVYPIKSCRGIRVDRVRMEESAFYSGSY